MQWLALWLVTQIVVTPAFAQTPIHTPPPTLQCPGDVIVWVNSMTGVYHYAGERYYGDTKQGKFVCEKDALAEGDRPIRDGK